jgi:hypothetical protein
MQWIGEKTLADAREKVQHAAQGQSHATGGAEEKTTSDAVWVHRYRPEL